MSALGDRLKALRDAKGLTNADLARAAGIDESTVQQILSGDIERPPDDRLQGFARVLDVSFDELRALVPGEAREAAAGAFIEARGDGSGHRWLIRVIKAGLSGNGNYYPAVALREAVPMFEGVRVFVKGDAEHLAGGGKHFNNLIGRLTGPHFVEGQGSDGGELRATLEVLESAGGVAARLKEAWQRGMADMFGFSIDARARVKAGRANGRAVREAAKFTKVDSVDLIVEPGAGGQVINLIEALAEDPDMKLRDKMLRFIEAQRPDLYRKLDLANPDDEKIEAAYREAAAKAADSGTIKGLGDADHDAPSRVQLIEGADDKTAKMLDALLDPKDSSVTSLKECYVTLTGDRRITGQLRECDQARMRESLGSGDFTSVLGDSIARRLLEDYRRPDLYSMWRQIANVVPVQDFRTQERTRFGGYGDLPTVAESDPYTALTSPTDEKATYAVTKRGGTEDLTLEMIQNDDVGAVMRIPRNLSRAAKRTLSKFVFDLIKDNPTIYDGIALFHASHNNLDTNALSGANVATGRLKMKRQTEKDSGDRLGIPPSFMMVPDDLEETAVDLFRRNTENDKTFIQSLTLDIVPVWYWTDANDWYLAADPMDIPGLEIGFLNGTQEPELFVQDNPSVGSMFSNDKATYKIRHIYGGNITDFRQFYGSRPA